MPTILYGLMTLLCWVGGLAVFSFQYPLALMTMDSRSLLVRAYIGFIMNLYKYWMLSTRLESDMSLVGA